MKQSWLQQVALITFTALTGLFLGVIVYFARESLLVVTIALATNAYLPRALDKFYLIVLGLIWLLGWFIFEGYMSPGIARNNLFARFLRILGWELIALFICAIVAFVYTSSGVNWLMVALLAAALAAGIFLLFTSRRMIAAPQNS